MLYYAIAGKHDGESDVDKYMRSLKTWLEHDWHDVSLYNGVIFLEDEDGETYSVTLDLEIADAEDRDPDIIIYPYDDTCYADSIDASFDPRQDADNVTKTLKYDISFLALDFDEE